MKNGTLRPHVWTNVVNGEGLDPGDGIGEKEMVLLARLDVPATADRHRNVDRFCNVDGFVCIAGSFRSVTCISGNQVSVDQPRANVCTSSRTKT